MYFRNNTFLIILILLTVFVSAPADENNDDKKDDKNAKTYSILVTANRRTTDERDATAGTTVLEKEDIKRAPGQHIEGLLKQQSGIDLWGSSITYKCAHSMALRGTQEQGRTLVLIDGAPLNDTWDDWVAWDQLFLDTVGRVEIIRGPHSSLYGSNAMGGVIHLRTEEILDKPAYGTVSVLGGSFGTHREFAKFAGQVDKIGYLFSAGHQQSDGYKPYADSMPNQVDNEFNRSSFDMKLQFQPDADSRLTVSGHYSMADRNRGRVYSTVDYDDVTRGSIHYSRQTDDIQWNVLFWGYDRQLKWELDKGPTFDSLMLTEDTDMNMFGGSIYPVFNLHKHGTLTIGAEFKESSVDKTDEYFIGNRLGIQSGKQRYYSLFSDYQLKLQDNRIILSVGARQDWWKAYDGNASDTAPTLGLQPFDTDFAEEDWSSFNPKAGITWHVSEQTSLKAAFGTAFRAPSPARLFLNLTRGPLLYLGNPELKPETFWSFEAGIEHSFNDALWVRLTGYSSTGSDFIGSRIIRAPFLYKMDNLAEVAIDGLELETQIKVMPGLHLSANYAWTRSEVTENDVDTSLLGNQLQHTPEHKGNIALMFIDPDFVDFYCNLNYVGEMFDDVNNTIPLGDYWTTDVKISRAFGQGFTAFVEMENLFDEEYLIPSFEIFKAPGRMIFVGAGYDF